MSSRPQSRVATERPNRNSYLGQEQDSAGATQHDTDPGLRRSASTTSTKVPDSSALNRGGTLRKKGSLRKRASLRRSGSRRSLHAGSVKSLRDADDDFNSVFMTPVPTSGNPTDILADRFQAWRKLLKDLITYFREIQSSYEARAKSLTKVSNVLNNTVTPSVFLSQGGLDDATKTLRGFHKHSITEANKAKDIEADVITQLSGLRNDLSQKIKEIKSLSGDFKNTVDKEKDGTRKAVTSLQEALSVAESDPASAGGKHDPFIVKLAVDRQVEKQIEEENYLHKAYLNLEGSGRELESIVVGEIQKAYNAYAGIMKREVDMAQNTVEELRAGPIAMPKDHEWDCFVENDESLVSPGLPLRRIEDIHYPGKSNPGAAEIRSGMLERKSKYLKSYTPGWYVLSPTHLHEFKSADHIHTQQPVMSLCLLDQRLGSRSQSDASSHKFSLKGRQAGGMHRGHSWVFRAESYDTMMAWFEDIRNLTEKTGEERSAFVRRHARSISVGSQSGQSVSSDGMEEDEADSTPYSANQSMKGAKTEAPPPQRPEPGGRFPSDINIHRDGSLQAPPSPSSGNSSGYKQDESELAAGALRPPHTVSDQSTERIYADAVPAKGRRDETGKSSREVSDTYRSSALVQEMDGSQPLAPKKPEHIQSDAGDVELGSSRLDADREAPVREVPEAGGKAETQERGRRTQDNAATQSAGNVGSKFVEVLQGGPSHQGGGEERQGGNFASMQRLDTSDIHVPGEWKGGS